MPFATRFMLASMLFCFVLGTTFGQGESDSINSRAKEWSVGILGGALYNTFSSNAGIKPLNQTDCNCPDYAFESDFGYLVGLVLGRPLTDGSWRFFGTLQAAYVSAKGGMYAPGDSLLRRQPDGSTEYQITEYRGTTEYSALELTPSVLMFIAGTPIAISAGVGVSRVLSTNFRSNYILLLPENATFDPSLCPECEYSSDGRTITYYNNEITGAASWMATAIAGIEAHLNSTDGQLVTAFRYRYGMTDLSTTSGTRVSALELSLSLRVFL